jgi:hypothetical protein
MLVLLGFLPLVMADRGTRGGTGNRMAAANLVAGQRTNRCTFRRAGRLVLGVRDGRRQSKNDSRQDQISHRAFIP